MDIAPITLFYLWFDNFMCIFSQGNEDLILVHDSLDYGDCRLSLAVSTWIMGVLIIFKLLLFELLY